MTTFTSDDREEAYKKILEKAPASPPHIVDSGASVMLKELTDEEIITIWGVESIWDDKLIEFARAILRKAKEK